MPHIFYGAVWFDGAPAPIGTVIEAQCEDVVTGIGGNPITTTQVGSYGSPSIATPPEDLLVQGDIDSGTPIEFYIKGLRAECHDPTEDEWVDTYPWQSDRETELDLFVSSEYTLTVASGGCCPISVAYDTTTVTVAAGTVGAFTNITGGVIVALEAITETYCGLNGWEGALVTSTTLITIPIRYNDAVITATCGFYNVTISSPVSAKFGDPDDWVDYDLWVSNGGHMTDTFDVTTVSSNMWSIWVPPTVGPLAAAETGQVEASVRIPQSVAPCAIDVVTATVTSQGDPRKSATLLLTTTVTGDNCYPHNVFLPLVRRGF